MLDPSNLDLRNLLLTTRADLQRLIHDQTAFAHFHLRRLYFETGDKAASSQIKANRKWIVPAIRDWNSMLQIDAAIINQSFKNYYFKLYGTVNNANAALFYDKKFGFGPKFTSSVKTLYSAPFSSVRTNGLVSKPYPLQCGVRQGCPVSPLYYTTGVCSLFSGLLFGFLVHSDSWGHYDHTMITLI